MSVLVDVAGAPSVCVCDALNPPQLLLSDRLGAVVVPGVPNAKVTELPAVRPRVEVSDATPPVGQEGGTPSGEVPVRAIVPVNAAVPLLVTVRNPVSGLAQIVPAELQPVPAPTLAQGVSPATGGPALQ